MSEPKHTPGPWEVNQNCSNAWGINSPSREELATVNAEDDDEMSAEDQANANLMAAAPDLLAALEAAKIYVALGSANSMKSTAKGREEAAKILSQVKAAIAKAKGEGESEKATV